MSIADAAGNVLAVGDFVIYATGTRSSALSFAVITDIKENREIITRNQSGNAVESTNVRVFLERRNPDGTLEKQMHYPFGYQNGPEWTGKYKRTKTHLADHNTVWDSTGNIHSDKFNQVLKLSRYYKVDNVTPDPVI